ncbi:lysophospholipase [Bifidobacterium primatium]|uniref:Lysophospholipase n=2 Tax=Bifidobacterium primatium TaxID=2045438 RepID=A0A2M9HBP8_9BIFI|nr:lysophospholipase [Bifidobacterium primatium]
MEAGVPSASSSDGSGTESGQRNDAALTAGDADSADGAALSGSLDPEWVPDTIIPGYQQRTLHLGEDDEGELTATFVRKDPSTLTWQHRFLRWKHAVPRRVPLAILYVHGWNDFFYRRHVSEFWESLGVAFYAVDLRKYGRSFHDGQTAGFIDDLHEYFTELNALRDLIVAELGDDVRILVLAHSCGGLTSSLWLSNKHPHHVKALALNSPWLELQGNRITRIMTTPVVKGFGLAGAKSVIPIRDPGFYGRTLWADEDGEWDYNTAYPWPKADFQTRAGWFDAIYRGQDEVSRGLDIAVPVLVCTSDKSMILGKWDEAMHGADTVLDVVAIRQNALNLGDFVSLARIRDGLHDLSMSGGDARRRYFGTVAAWANQYAWSGRSPHRPLRPAAIERALDVVAQPRGGV